MSSQSRARQNRRDRRKAKASNWTREGTVNPTKVTHHLSESHVGDDVGRFRMKRGRKKNKTRTIEAEIGTNLGDALRAALEADEQ